MQLKALAQDGRLVATRLYLVRHGQVADGHTEIYNGHNDVGLSPSGVRQCEALAQHLQDVHLSGIYASNLIRTRRGAEIIGRDRGLEVETVPGFRELNFGHWEGLSFAQITERYPEELQNRLGDLTNFRIPGGESLTDVKDRALPELERLLQRHRGENFLIVAHAGINRVILCHALGLSFQQIFHLEQAYAGLNIIDFYSDLAVVKLMNGIFYNQAEETVGN
jgi:alpha-ribazole phosphatase